MSKKPVADNPTCDVPGCNHAATIRTDGTEVDIQKLNRPAVPNIQVCDPHSNWPHSDDAIVFAATNLQYKQRATK